MKSKAFVFFTFSCTLLAASPSARAQVSFFQPPTYAGNGDVFVADFNGDGKPDLLTADGIMNFGSGDGTFKTSAYVGVAYVHLMADFNGDGKPDLLVEKKVSTFFVMLGNGDGTFQAPTSTAIDVTFSSAAADLNGDGKADVVEGNNGSLYVFISNGDGAFKPGVSYTPGTSESILIADFNGDGSNDVALNTPLQVVVFLGNGDGTLQAPRFSAGIPNASLASLDVVGDFNGDGKTDLVISDEITSNTRPPSREYLLLGTGDGTFLAPTVLFLGQVRVAAADLNRDGKLDLVRAGGLSSDPSAGTVSEIYLGSGNGTFSEPMSFVSNFPSPALRQGGPLSIGDLNLDGELDIASSGGILLGNGDGTFQAIPLATFSLPPSSIAVGDFENNGRSDVAVVTSSQSGVVTSNLHILRNDGSGALSLLYTYPLAHPGLPLVGDLDGDGNLDLVIVENPTGGYSAFLGNGDGSFQSPALYKNGYFWLATLVDLNHDRTLDLAEEAMGGQIGVSLGNGDGTFASTVGYLTWSSTQALVIGDFNGDGTLDIAYPSGMYELNQNYTEIMYGNGDGTFQLPSIPADLNNFGVLAAADFRNLGRADLLGDNSIPSAPIGNQVALSNGDGTFTVLPPLTYRGFPVPDINGDGKVDLFVGNIPAVGPPQCLTAVALGNGDGSFRPLMNFAGTACYPFISSFPIVDMNGDGRPDVVFVWGPGVGVLLNTTASSFELFPSALSPAATTAGTSATSTVVVVPTFGFTETVTLSCAGLPTGSTCAFNPPSVANSSGSSALTIATSSSTALGTYSIQVQGTAGSVVNSAAVSLVIQAPPDFSFGPATGSSKSQTVAAGQAASFSLALSPSASFTGTVNLTCAIAPNVSRGPTCSLPSSVQISGSGSQSVEVSVRTTAPVTTSSLSRVDLPPANRRLLWALILLGTALLCTPRRKRISALAKATVVMIAVELAACGGNSGNSSSSLTTPGTPAGTYTTTITATSGTLSHSTSLNVVVQ